MIIYWTNTAGGNFNTASNWQTDQLTPVNQVPGVNDVAVMSAPGFTIYDDNGATTTVLGFTTSAGTTAGTETTFEIEDQSTFTVAEGTPTGANAGEVYVLNSTLNIVGGTLNNTGSIDIDGPTNPSALNFGTDISDPVTLTGSGQINLEDNNASVNLVATFGAEQVTNLNNTIEGTGTISLSAGDELINDATINADNSGQTLELSGGAGSVIDNDHGSVDGGNGTLDVTGLTLDDTSAGFIGAGGGGTVEIGDSTVVGGTFVILFGGNINLDNGAVLDGGGTHPITNEAVLSIVNAATVTMAGVIDNDGAVEAAIDLDSTGFGSITKLVVGIGTDTTLTLEGGGDVALSNDNAVAGIFPETGTFSTPIELINVNNDISGESVFEPGLTVDNEKDGVIDATGSHIDIFGTADNAGLLEATGGSTLSLFVVNNTPSGVITAGTGSSVTTGSTSSITGGTLKGGGNFNFQSTSLSSLTNAASVTLQLAGVKLSGTIKNTGYITCAETFAPEIELEGSSFTLAGGGDFDMLGDGTVINGETASTVFDNDGNTIYGQGTIEDLIFHNTAGAVEASGVSPLIIDTGTNTISNAATMAGADGSELYLASPVSNSGTLVANYGTVIANKAVTGGVAQIYGNGEIVFGAAASTGVKFESGSDGMLVLDAPTLYTGTISDFTDTQGIDLAGIADTSPLVSFSGGVLTINGGPGEIVHLHFSGSYTLSEFSLYSDGSGGSILIDPEVDAAANAASATNVALLGSYMASLFATPEGQIGAQTATAETAQSQAVLAHPHTG